MFLQEKNGVNFTFGILQETGKFFGKWFHLDNLDGQFIYDQESNTPSLKSDSHFKKILIEYNSLESAV